MMRTPAVICAPTATVDVHADVAEAAATMMKSGVALDDLVRRVGHEAEMVSEFFARPSATEPLA